MKDSLAFTIVGFLVIPAAAFGGIVTSSDSFIGLNSSLIDFNLDGVNEGQPIFNTHLFADQGIILPEAAGGDGGEAFTLVSDGDPSVTHSLMMQVFGPLSNPFGDPPVDATGVITIDFIEPVDLAGFEYTVGEGEELYFEAYAPGDHTTPVEQYSFLAPEGTTGFLGFDLRGLGLVNRLVLHDSSYNFWIDDLQFYNSSAVPAPGALLLGAVGVGALWLALRRNGQTTPIA